MTYPPGGTPWAPPTRPPTPRNDKRLILIAVSISIALVTVAAVAIVATRDTSSQSSPAERVPLQTTPTTPYLPATTPRISDEPTQGDADAQVLRFDALTETDVGAGWTRVYNKTLPNPPAGSGCTPGLVLPPNAAELDQDFSYRLQANGGEEGHIRVSVFTTRTTDDLRAHVRAVEDQPGFEQCVEDGVASILRQSVGAGNVGKPSTSVLHTSLAGPTYSYETVTLYTYQGQVKRGFADVIDVPSGRAFASVEFDHCCQPFSRPFEDQVVEALLRRLATSFAK